MVKMAGMCLLSSTATEESRVEALEVVLETVQVEEKPFRALLRKLCKPPMRAEDSTGWNNKEKSSNNPCTCPPPTYNSKIFFSKDWSEISGTDIFLISIKTISTTNMYCTSF